MAQPIATLTGTITRARSSRRVRRWTWGHSLANAHRNAGDIASTSGYDKCRNTTVGRGTSRKRKPRHGEWQRLPQKARKHVQGCERGPEEEEASQQPGPPVTSAGEQQQGSACAVPGEQDHRNRPPRLRAPDGSLPISRAAAATSQRHLDRDSGHEHVDGAANEGRLHESRREGLRRGRRRQSLQRRYPRRSGRGLAACGGRGARPAWPALRTAPTVRPGST